MNRAWFRFYGGMLHMDKQEIMTTRYGEMMDMIACLSIHNGATPKRRKKKFTFQEAIALR